MKAVRTAIPRYRETAGPALLEQGFRPFFLGAAVWAAIALALWILSLAGALTLPSALDPLTWHVHEMLYGFVVATVAGFLLTAIPNWTGRMPLQGLPLLVLVLAWLAGRAATATSALIGAWPAALIDLAFLAILLAVVLREILAGKNWRNLPMAGAVVLLLAGNALIHAEALALIGSSGLGWRLAIGITLVLVSLVGGRIIPSFTRNWLARRGDTRLPAAFGLVDRLALVATLLALACWSFLPESPVAAVALLLAAGLQAARLARWRGHATLAEPLVWILHLAYAWMPVGLALLAASHWISAVTPTLAIHALTVGTIGSITLAVMTRATLGHTGRALTAGAGTTLIYLAVTLAAASRLAAAALPDLSMLLLTVSGAAWIAAFGGFALVYGPALLRPRLQKS